MLARKAFRISLYKMILLKNVVENKMHKEKMAMLYAFEQMIINTEDDDGEEDEYGDEDYPEYDIPYGYFEDPNYPGQLMRYPIEQEYMAYPEDIIDEEEFEESEFEYGNENNGNSSPPKSKRNAPKMVQEPRILEKVTANDILEFAAPE